MGGDKSIPWKACKEIATKGYTYEFRSNPRDLLSLKEECKTHADLMSAVMHSLGVPASRVLIYPPDPTTRSCPRGLGHGDEKKFFKYNSADAYYNLHAVCSVNTSDAGTIHYDCTMKADSDANPDASPCTAAWLLNVSWDNYKAKAIDDNPSSTPGSPAEYSFQVY